MEDTPQQDKQQMKIIKIEFFMGFLILLIFAIAFYFQIKPISFAVTDFNEDASVISTNQGNFRISHGIGLDGYHLVRYDTYPHVDYDRELVLQRLRVGSSYEAEYIGIKGLYAELLIVKKVCVTEGCNTFISPEKIEEHYLAVLAAKLNTTQNDTE